MLNSNFQFSTFNFQLNTLFPFQKVLQAEAFPHCFLYIPVHHSFLYFACFVLPFEVVSVINQCRLYKLKLSINSPAVGNHRISVCIQSISASIRSAIHTAVVCVYPFSCTICLVHLLFTFSIIGSNFLFFISFCFMSLYFSDNGGKVGIIFGWN